MSSAELRPARWPWIVLGVFIGVAIVGMVFVFANGEDPATQWPYVIAFTTFGVVGALISSSGSGSHRHSHSTSR